MPDEVDHDDRGTRLREKPAFRRLVAGWALSNLGDSLLLVGVAVWVRDLTGSDSAAGLVFLFLTLPTLAAPIGGQLADRVSRRRLIVGADVVGAATVLVLVFVESSSSLWLIYLVVAVYGAVNVVTSAAGAGLARDVLNDDELVWGNGLLSSIDQSFRLIVPPIGVALYAAKGSWPLVVSASALLAVAAVLINRVPVVETIDTAQRGSRWWNDMWRGVHHLRDTKPLARTTVCSAIAFAASGLTTATVFAVIDEGLGRDAAFLGVLSAGQGAGAVIGGLSAARLSQWRGEGGAIRVALVTLGFAMGALLTPLAWVAVPAMVFVGLSVSWFVVTYISMTQRLSPGEIQGRVSAATHLAIVGGQTVGIAIGAAALAVVDFRVLVASAAGVVVLSGLAARGAPSVASGVET